MKDQVELLTKKHQLISEIATRKGSSYFPLPKKLRNPLRGLIYI